MWEALKGEPAEATYIIQRYIAQGLEARGHQLSFLVPVYHQQIICSNNLLEPKLAMQTWSASSWFNFARKASWSLQKLVGIPYLNVFSDLCLMDAALHCLPGHNLVYERNGMYKSGIAMACKRLGIPFVLYFEADDILEHDIMGKPITGLLRWRARQTINYNLTRADCIICVSEPGKTHLIDHWGIPAEKIVVFPNVADTTRFKPDPDARARVREKLGYQDEPLIIFVGNFYQWHDVPTLLEAFARVIAEYPSARLILVGDGERRQAMMQLADQLGLGQVTRFTGMVTHEEVPNYLAAADIGIVPYPPMDTDLWLSPLKLYEYMASGLVVVASDIGQLNKTITDGVNGLLVPPGDAVGMAEAIIRLLLNKELRTQLGAHARNDAVQKHSWDEYINRLESLFRAVIAGEPILKFSR